ncbi:hypothetical protein B0H17DRAFT_1123872 [Mycena rosella]|uniref:mRNA 3'-end-processing protein RNA14 n=1 Tax=Mycena rosella TaxID=1033263 RepID=A0AAD7H346_MYCRO|nr:hypothetical protein B0H17DRAFT_1123872 [Mycena rosella]
MSETFPPNSPIPQPSGYDALLAQLKKSPQGPESWKWLLQDAEASGDTLRVRQLYEVLLEQYPNNPSTVARYMTHVTNTASPTEVETFFIKYVHPSPSVAIWKSYIDYLKHKPSTGYDNLCKTYDFVLKQVGQDRDSGSLWADYIRLLKPMEADNAWEAQEKIDALRRVFRCALQIPLNNIKQLWSDFEAFEIGLNKIAAKKSIPDLYPAYIQAQIVLPQLSTYLSGLGLTPTSDTIKLALPAFPTFTPQDRAFVGRWKAYLMWEEGNPLEIDAKDFGTLIIRVQMAYRKAILRMRYYPEIWFMAYYWNASVGRHDEALNILKDGLEANPDSFALTYAYAEVLEKAELKKDQRDFSEVHSLYERFFGVLRANLVRLSAAAAAGKPTKKPTTDANGTDVPAPTPGPPTINLNQEELDEHKKQFTNAYINYMRFARRAEGHQAYRKAFSKGLRDEFIGWEAFEAAALTEYRCNTENAGRALAGSIFEAGMKKYKHNVDYVLNAHALFESIIGTFTPQQAGPIWECWSRSQYQYDLDAALKLEQRMARVYPNDPPIKRLAQRYKYHSIDAIAGRDLGLGVAKIWAGGTPAIPPLTETLPDAAGPDNCNPNASRNGNDNNNENINGKGITVTVPAIANRNKRTLTPADRKGEDASKRRRPDV